MKATGTEIEERLRQVRAELVTSDHVIGDDEISAEDELTFLFLEKELQTRELSLLSQLPIRGKEEVIQLVNALPFNLKLFAAMQKVHLTDCIHLPASQHLIERSKFVSKSQVICPYFTGTPFRSTWDQSLHSDSILDLGDPQYPSVIGFALPSRIECTRIGKIYNTFKIFRSQEDFVQARLRELDLPPGAKTAWQGEPKPGYNVTHKKAYGDIAFTFVREYRQFSLSLRKDAPAELKHGFKSRLKEVCEYVVQDDFFALKQWEDFFNTYGTHIVKSAFGGGRLVMTVLENSLKNYLGTEQLKSKGPEIEEILAGLLDHESSSSAPGPPLETLLISSIRLFGGDPMFKSKDLTQCGTRAEVRRVIGEWIQTLPFQPIMLDTEVELISIPDLLEARGLSDEARLMDKALKKIHGKGFQTLSPPVNQAGRRWSLW